MKKILITGGTGFIGQALATSLLSKGFSVRVTGLLQCPSLEALGAEWFPMPDLRGNADWAPALAGVDAVVHLAGLAHRIGVDPGTEADDYDWINHMATRSLARSLSKNSSISRFLFMSSIAVHGKPRNLPLEESDPCNPINVYGQSKLMAECAIRDELKEHPVKWAILRPVLVYGPGNPGNMARLESLLRRGIPIPVASIGNQKSFLYIGNLIASIERYLTISNPPSGATWIVADEKAISTERLIRIMAAAMDMPAKVIHLPHWFLTGIARVGDALCNLGLASPWNSEIQEKLLGDLYVDTKCIKRELNWRLPFTTEDGIRLTFRQ